MQLSTTRRITSLRDKIPDIQKTLDTVLFLKTRTASSPPLRTTFSLSPTLYAHAVIPPPSSSGTSTPSAAPTSASEEPEGKEGIRDKSQGQEKEQEVYLWLGANIMLSYPISDAEALLREKLEAAKTALSGGEEDAEFLREQITVCSPISSMLFFLCIGLRCGDLELGFGLGLGCQDLVMGVCLDWTADRGTRG